MVVAVPTYQHFISSIHDSCGNPCHYSIYDHGTKARSRFDHVVLLCITEDTRLVKYIRNWTLLHQVPLTKYKRRSRKAKFKENNRSVLEDK